MAGKGVLIILGLKKNNNKVKLDPYASATGNRKCTHYVLRGEIRIAEINTTFTYLYLPI